MSRLDIDAIRRIYQSDKGIINVLTEYSEKNKDTGDEGKYHVPLPGYQAEVDDGDCVTYETTIKAGNSLITRTQELCQSKIDPKLYIIKSPGAKTVPKEISGTLLKKYGFMVETCLSNTSLSEEEKAFCYTDELTFKPISKYDYDSASRELSTEMENSAKPGSTVGMKDSSQTRDGEKIIVGGMSTPDTKNLLVEGM
jgi:hypothetical protein